MVASLLNQIQAHCSARVSTTTACFAAAGTTASATYTDNSPGPRRIVRLDPNGSKRIELYVPANPAAKVSHLAVSPDAEQLAFLEADFDTGQLTVKVISAAKGGDFP